MVGIVAKGKKKTGLVRLSVERPPVIHQRDGGQAWGLKIAELVRFLCTTEIPSTSLKNKSSVAATRNRVNHHKSRIGAISFLMLLGSFDAEVFTNLSTKIVVYFSVSWDGRYVFYLAIHIHGMAGAPHFRGDKLCEKIR